MPDVEHDPLDRRVAERGAELVEHGPGLAFDPVVLDVQRPASGRTCHHRSSSMSERYRTSGSAGRCSPYGPGPGVVLGHRDRLDRRTSSTPVGERQAEGDRAIAGEPEAAQDLRDQQEAGHEQPDGLGVVARDRAGRARRGRRAIGWPSTVSIRVPIRSSYGGSASTITTSSSNSHSRNGRLSTGYVPVPQTNAPVWRVAAVGADHRHDPQRRRP